MTVFHVALNKPRKQGKKTSSPPQRREKERRQPSPGPCMIRKTRENQGRTFVAQEKAAYFERPCVTGVWKKNKALSEDMRPLHKITSMRWLARKREQLVKYLQIEDTLEHFRRTTTCTLFETVETYPLGGQAQSMRRRDLRRGRMMGRVQQTASGPRLCIKWGKPRALELWELYSISNDGETLTVYTSVARAGCVDDVTVRSVYTRVTNGCPPPRKHGAKGKKEGKKEG